MSSQIAQPVRGAVEEEGAEPARAGAVFDGKYEIVALLGGGGMARVYRAIQRPLGRPVALKVLRLDLDWGADSSSRERFFLEASMMARLKHPNTVTIYDFGWSEGGDCYIALELLEGETLRALLARDRSMGWVRALRIGAQIAGSLAEAHRMGLVHRDLKPSNIMVLAEGALGDLVKVLDFGLVKHSRAIAAPEETVRQDLTRAGVVLGSPHYIAPEQVQGTTDLRSDIYSLGAVLFTAMAGRPPFVGKHAIELLMKHVSDRPPDVGDFAPMPRAASSLVMRCLEKAPADRFRDGDELLRAIHEVLRHTHTGPPAAPGREPGEETAGGASLGISSSSDDAG